MESEITKQLKKEIREAELINKIKEEHLVCKECHNKLDLKIRR